MTETKLIEMLRNKGFRATPLRKKALEMLVKTKEAVTIQELYERLSSPPKKESPDWTTIYRILNQFEECGLVFSFEAGGSKKFEYADSQSSHHHHLICRECKRIEHLAACKESPLKSMVESSNFKNITHKLEFYGLCPECFEGE